MAKKQDHGEAQQPEEEAQKLSDKLTAFVNILFGVVIGQSISNYSDLILHPSLSLPFFALLTLYVTVILSWAGYHRALLRYPYRYSTVGLGRLIIDILIVGVYAFLLFEIGTIKKQGGAASLDGYFLGFFMVYLLYLFFILARWAQYRSDKRAKSFRTPAMFAGGFFLLFVSYKFAAGFFSTEILNWVYIWLPLGLTINYRLVRK